MVNTAPIENPSVLIKPSEQLISYISKIKQSDSPFAKKNKSNKSFDYKLNYLVTLEDRKYLKSLGLDETNQETKLHSSKPIINKCDNDVFFNLKQLHWLHDYIHIQNKSNKKKVYFHELLKGSEIVLPENVVVPRNKELEARCRRLKAQQQNLEYNAMTKNVDSVRKRYPEDTMSFQIQQMNRHLIAVFQFVVSVLAGFAFGFIGVELIIGKLDFGFRLLLGIICSLIIALAELYFLAKKLNEDLQFEVQASLNSKKVN